MISATPLPVSASGTTATSDVVAAGLPILPIERIRIFSDSQWDQPSDLGTDANIIRFTGASHGSQGFIQKNV